MKCRTCIFFGRVAIILTMPIWGWAVVLYGDRVRLFILNGWAGCWPWSPKEVPYYPGMTLCPGQRAYTTMAVTLPVPADQVAGMEVVVTSSSPDIEVSAEFVLPKERMN